MAAHNVGDTFPYTADNDVTYLATVLNTFDAEDGTNMATISLSGCDKVIEIENGDA